MIMSSNKAMRLIVWRMPALQSVLGQHISPVLQSTMPGRAPALLQPFMHVRSSATDRRLHGSISATSEMPAGRHGGADLTDESAHAASAPCGPDEAESLLWRKTYQLSGRGIRNQCSTHTADGFSIDSDIPKAMGGGNTAPQPVYQLLAALVGCETATANFVGEGTRVGP